MLNRSNVAAFVLPLLLGATSCEMEIESEGEGPRSHFAFTKVLQAEDRTFKVNAEERSNHAGYRGRGFMDFGFGTDTWIEWGRDRVQMPSTGEYTLKLRYANARSRDRQCSVMVNGDVIGSVAFRSTGAWTTWKVATIKATLKAGNNKIRIKAKSEDVPIVSAADVGESVIVDIEDGKSFFNGRLGDINESSLKNLSKVETGKMITKLIGSDNVSKRLDMSLKEIGKTIVSWPQLGGTALLNGAVTAHTVRRILSGKKVKNT